MQLSPAAVVLFPGTIAASVGLFGNLALQIAGPVPLALDRKRSTGFNPATRLRIITLHCKRAEPLITAIGAISAAFALFPTFAYPNPFSKGPLRFSATAFLLLNPYTLYTLLDLNKQLFAFDRTIVSDEAGTLRLPEADGLVTKIMDVWSFWASLRIGFFAAGWLGMVTGLGKELCWI